MVRALKITKLERYYLTIMGLGEVSHVERKAVWCVTYDYYHIYNRILRENFKNLNWSLKLFLGKSIVPFDV